MQLNSLVGKCNRHHRAIEIPCGAAWILFAEIDRARPARDASATYAKPQQPTTVRPAHKTAKLLIRKNKNGMKQFAGCNKILVFPQYSPSCLIKTGDGTG
jgi:hypothetical protein